MPKATPDRRPATRAEGRALAHPLRLRILRLCLDEALTNRGLADRLNEQPATVLYHVRTLVRTGFLRREEERRGRRGAREVPYRSTRKSWALNFEPDIAGNLAVLDATRSELIEAGPEAVLALTRMAVRLDADRVEALERAVTDLVHEAEVADGSGPEPIGILIAVHRRR
jgi:DNA-binding transcriptional ArsR family regulator